MRISKPLVKLDNGRAYLISSIEETKRCVKRDLWFSVPAEYESFMCTDSLDAMAVALLLVAMAAGEDMECDAPISKRLLFNLINTVQPIFAKIVKHAKCVNIKVPSFATYGNPAKGIGCGCSLGVDSLASLFAQQDEKVPVDYHVSHLALFNCGQLGDDNPQLVEENFKKSIKESEPFARAVNLPIVSVDSNINEFYLKSGVTLLQSFVLRTISCAMVCQNGWGRYVYGSSYPINSISWSTWDASHFESSYVPLLATEVFEPILANSMMGRVDKTDFIAKNALTSKFLRVCWAEQTALETWHNTAYLNGKVKINCGWCGKCLRTLLTLEALGYDLADYAANFELSKYYEHREKFICDIVSDQSNVFYKEILELLILKNFAIPESAKKILKRNARSAKIQSCAKKVMNRLRRFI